MVWVSPRTTWPSRRLASPRCGTRATPATCTSYASSRPELNFSKSLEYIDKVVLVFSSACNKVEDNANKGKLCVVVEEFKASLAVDPIHLAHNVDLHFGLCKVLVKYGRGKDALDSCSEALKIDEELVEALVQAIVC
ncbi:hypothetical protein glysoja_044580 [Glycine soja]|uniref:Uncharacterized protein n=1 Tax=Glycine soja TaxID=3848 RepID=A0A0B2RQH2_GLYSO|nr:hypothetical protein glysoja_044580 [Glycine soja]